MSFWLDYIEIKVNYFINTTFLLKKINISKPSVFKIIEKPKRQVMDNNKHRQKYYKKKLLEWVTACILHFQNYIFVYSTLEMIFSKNGALQIIKILILLLTPFTSSIMTRHTELTRHMDASLIPNPCNIESI